MKKIKFKIFNQIVDGEIKKDLHYCGGKKVVYVLPNDVTGHTSLDLVQIIDKNQLIE